ncbi:MAG: PD-(D/E)XK nuclease-like domain-containing protein [Bacteroidales bacterium]|nr:PD-(D/E)XK nuclease-like domain-containing protein [Bacteroidales bacterium]
METVINEEFLKKRPISQTKLKKFRKSPRHYILSLDKKGKDTDAKIIGSATDCLLIDNEDEFNKLFLPYTNFEKRTKEAKEEWSNLINRANIEKKKLITNDQIKLAQECVDAIKNYPDAQKYLKFRKRHPKMIWIDQETKLPCIAIPDWDCLLDNQLCVVSLKTADDSDPIEFTKDAWNYEYFVQIGAELAGYKHLEFQFPMYVYIVVETSELHNVSINFVENKYLEFSKEEYHGTLRAFKYCLDNNLWHMGYEFRLMDTAGYFALRKPGYGKPLFGSWD